MNFTHDPQYWRLVETNCVIGARLAFPHHTIANIDHLLILHDRNQLHFIEKGHISTEWLTMEADDPFHLGSIYDLRIVGL